MVGAKSSGAMNRARSPPRARSPHGPPVIDIRGVSKSFRRAGRSGQDAEVTALRDVSFTIGSGEFVCLLGPSGCGKTTLLRIINGLIAPNRGEVSVDGRRSPEPGPWAGFVFQSFRLMPWLTVLGNVTFPLEIQGLDPKLRHERAREYVRLVGLERFGDSYPHELSGGMQQRVALARAL